jgi:hypothetical protein
MVSPRSFSRLAESMASSMALRASSEMDSVTSRATVSWPRNVSVVRSGSSRMS